MKGYLGRMKRVGGPLCIAAALCLFSQAPALAARGPLISGTETAGPAEGPALEAGGVTETEQGAGSVTETEQGGGGVPGSGLKAGTGLGTETGEVCSEEQLADDIIEYGELEALLRAGNATVKSVVASQENDLANYQTAYDILVSARRDMLNEADELEDENGDPALIAQYESSASILSSSAKQMKKNINSLTSATSQGSLNRSVDAVVKSAQTLMSSYKEMESQAETAEKRVEAAEAVYERMERSLAAGLATEEELLNSEKSLLSARISCQSAVDSAGSLKRQLAVMIGRDAETIQIGDIPPVSTEELASLNLEEDKKKAVIADSSVKSIQNTSVTGDANRNLRRQQLEEARGEENITMDTLYQTIVEKSLQYDAALAAWTGAEQDYGALQTKYAAGLINREEFLTGEAAYLEKKALKENASIELSQAAAAYWWELKGVG